MGGDLGKKVDKTTKNVRMTGIGINFLQLGQGSVDFIEVYDLTREQAQKLKKEYETQYQIEIGVIASKELDTYTLRARRKSQGDK